MVSFDYFTALWNAQQGQDTPHVHFKMGRWLEDMLQKKKNRLLLMAFRAAGKSTIVALYAAWRLLCDPNVRILVISADEILAGKMVRNIKRIIERHALTQHLKPKDADQWAGERFTVVREKELRDPSVIARSISANMTGSRADIIICDDVEVPNTCGTPEKRRDLRTRLGESEFILTPGGLKLYVGTPHHYQSIYAEQILPDHEEDRPFLEGYERLCLPLLEEDGGSAWPERYSLQEIENLRHSSGPNRFQSQMMLQPVNILNGRLDASLLQIYEGEIVYVKELNQLEINNVKMISAAAWWDPAFAAEGGDRSVLAICYTDKDGAYWLQHLETLKPQRADNTDMASAQAQQVATLLKQYMVPSVSIEINGLGRFLPGILRKELAQQNVPCSVREVTSRRPKEVRILEAFDVLLASERLHVNKNVMQTAFATELSEWRPGKVSGHDDCLDAVAGALSMQPVRMGAHPARGTQVWTENVKPLRANTDFKV